MKNALKKWRWASWLGLFGLIAVIFSFQNCGQGFEQGFEMDTLQSGHDLNDSQFNNNENENGQSLSYLLPPIEMNAGAIRISDIDTSASQCPEPNYQGFLCSKQSLRSAEGLVYNVTFRWNRPNQSSLGTIMWVTGGDGHERWRDYPALPAIEDSFSQSGQLRSVEVEFTDISSGTGSGGYWIHAGGYYSASLAFMEALKFVNTNLKKGSFLNYVGGSNGTMVATYAASHFGAADSINRMVLHAGPFLSDLVTACNPSTSASFYRSPNQLSIIFSFLGDWTFKDSKRNVCDNLPNARVSLLTGGTIFNYPKTAIHVAMGDKEKTDGFGPWILASNLEWYSKIQALEKTRVIDSALGHEMNWTEVRKYAGLAPGAKPPVASPPVVTPPSAPPAQVVPPYLAPVAPPSYEPPIPAGLFMIGIDINYSNGSHWCHFDTMVNFRRLVGNVNTDDLPRYSKIPSSMVYDGICQGS